MNGADQRQQVIPDLSFPECENIGSGDVDDFKVSVIIPIFNVAPYLCCAVESALQQPEVGEVVLVEDGSTDESFAVAESLSNLHPDRIRLCWHEGHVNKGPGESRNVGLREARCPFVAFLDGDDWYLPGCFAFDKKAFKDDPGLDMVRHSLGNAYDPGDEDQRWFQGFSRSAKDKFCSYVEDIKPSKYFQSIYPMGPITGGIADVLTIRRDLANSVGGFPKRYWAEDIAFHLKVASLGRVAFADMEQPMAMRRIHANNLSRTHADNIATRMDAMAISLMDVMAFLKARKRPSSHKVALHKGWVRIGSRLTSMRSFSLIAAAPETIVYPSVFWLYFKFYAVILSRILQRKLVSLWRGCSVYLHKIGSVLDRVLRGPALPVFVWERNSLKKRLNWGDDLNVNLIGALTGMRINTVRKQDCSSTPHFMVIGSVLSFANSKTTVWGAGAIALDHVPAVEPARICAVRGPLTHRAIEAAGFACPTIYGDPALLLKRFYRPSGPRHGKVVVVPHYIDGEHPMVAKLVELEHAVLLRPDCYKFWLDFVDTIAGASRVYASSLHALIVAEAYNVPSVWVRFTNGVYGGDFKYLDFYESIGKHDQRAFLITDTADAALLGDIAGRWTPGTIDLDPLIKACPFALRDTPFTRSEVQKKGKRH